MDEHSKMQMLPALPKGKDLLRGLRLIGTTKEGDFRCVQGFNNMGTVISRGAVGRFLHRFDWQSREKINKQLENKK